MSSLFAVSGCVSTTGAAAKTGAPEPEVVAAVDLARYAGRWYEIASIPQSFQRGCHCTRATYTPTDEPGEIEVLNECRRGGVDGPLSKAEGKARVVDPATNAKLKVGFFLPGVPIFEGDYWIVGLDEDYRWAVISNPDRSSLWILSRTPTLAPALHEAALARARSQALKVDELVTQVQDGCDHGPP